MPDNESVSFDRLQVNLSQIKQNPDNPRRIGKREIEKLKKSLKEFPEMMALREIIVDESMTILGGNARYLALKGLGEKECIIKVARGLSPEQKREFIIKDNSNFGEWDMDALANGWDDLPLDEWGMDLPEDWLSGGIEVLESAGKLSGMNYGDQKGDSVPINLLGIGGLIERDLMLRVKQHLLDMGAIEDEDSTEQLTAFFLGAIS